MFERLVHIETERVIAKPSEFHEISVQTYSSIDQLLAWSSIPNNFLFFPFLKSFQLCCLVRLQSCSPQTTSLICHIFTLTCVRSFYAVWCMFFYKKLWEAFWCVSSGAGLLAYLVLYRCFIRLTLRSISFMIHSVLLEIIFPHRTRVDNWKHARDTHSRMFLCTRRISLLISW